MLQCVSDVLSMPWWPGVTPMKAKPVTYAGPCCSWTELQHCCLQPVFFWSMVQTLPCLLISVSLGLPQPDPSVSLEPCIYWPRAVLHPMLFFAALAALSSSPAPMPWSAPCSTASWTEIKERKGENKKRRKKKQRQQERTEKGKKQTLEESGLQVLCLSQNG